MTDETHDTAKPDRDETPAERLDRKWDELLQELRVTQTGVQILFAFLLVLPFQSRFEEVLEPFDRRLYAVVIVLVTVSTILNLAPVALHRVLFGNHQKDVLVRVSSRFATWSFTTLGLALVGAIWLAMDAVTGLRAGWLVAAATLALVVVLWFVVPLTLKQRHEDTGSSY